MKVTLLVNCQDNDEVISITQGTLTHKNKTNQKNDENSNSDHKLNVMTLYSVDLHQDLTLKGP